MAATEDIRREDDEASFAHVNPEERLEKEEIVMKALEVSNSCLFVYNGRTIYISQFGILNIC